MNIPVHHASLSDVDQAACILSAAFKDYPWTRWSVPCDDYLDRLQKLQAIYLRHALAHGLVFVDHQVKGAVALVPTDAPEPSDDAQTRIAELLGDRLHVLMSVQRPAPPAGSWDLATLGVHPDSWGQGIASALLTQALAQMDASHATVTLETSDTRNVTLYSRHGFRLTDTTDIADGLTVYSMLRKPTGGLSGQRRFRGPTCAQTANGNAGVPWPPVTVTLH